MNTSRLQQLAGASLLLALALGSAAGCSDDKEGQLLGIANAPSSGGNAGTGSPAGSSGDAAGTTAEGGSSSVAQGGTGSSTTGPGGTGPDGESGATGDGGNGQAGASSVCGDDSVSLDEQCDDGNVFDGDGCGSDCRDVCESCEQERCVDLEGSNYLEFVYQNSEQALDGPAAGLMKSELSVKLVGCLRRTGCFLQSYDLMGCYCGQASSSDCLAGSGTGACRDAIEWAVEATDAATLVGLLEDVTLSSGQVAALMKDCDLRQCGDVCLPVTCAEAAHWNPTRVYQLDDVAVATCLTGDCSVGKLQRFGCVASALENCSLLQPGTAGWEAAWSKLAECP